MISYFLPTLIFRKKWVWFSDPHDVEDADMVTFFSYTDMSPAGFSRKGGVTSVIDLTNPIEVLWNNVRKKFTQQPIREGEQKGIRIERDSNFREFGKVYTVFRDKKEIARDRFDLFEKHGILFSAYHRGRMIAGHVFISDGTIMRSWVAASQRLSAVTWEERRLIGCANRMLIWKALTYAQMSGHRLFDLGGLDTKEGHPLAEFKESFGGRRVPQYYYIKVYSPILRLWVRIRH